MTRWRVGQFLLINRKNKNRYQNENSQSNCFLSVVPVAGGPVEISGAFCGGNRIPAAHARP